MRITHYGHSCVLLDTGTARLLLDPGSFSTGFEALTGLTAVLVTHQHPDHLDPDRLDPVLRANPDARLVVDPGSAALLSDRDPLVARPGELLELGGARVAVHGGRHAVLHPDLPVIDNNAYLVDDAVLHPGDALVEPPGPVDVLLLPTAAPWLKLAEAVDYLRAVAPRVAVPVHEKLLARPGLYYGLFDQLSPDGTAVRVLEPGTAATP